MQKHPSNPFPNYVSSCFRNLAFKYHEHWTDPQLAFGTNNAPYVQAMDLFQITDIAKKDKRELIDWLQQQGLLKR